MQNKTEQLCRRREKPSWGLLELSQKSTENQVPDARSGASAKKKKKYNTKMKWMCVPFMDKGSLSVEMLLHKDYNK